MTPWGLLPRQVNLTGVSDTQGSQPSLGSETPVCQYTRGLRLKEVHLFLNENRKYFNF